MAMLRLLLVLLLFAWSPALLYAQESEVITGRVTDPAGQPIAGARVVGTSAETGVSRNTLTDANGRYMLLFRDGGGRFELRISFLGYAEQVVPVIRTLDEDVLVANVRMQQQAIRLDALQVRAQRPPGSGESGATSRTLSQAQLDRLPLADFDPTTLALMAAGVMATGDSLSTLGFSIGGLADALNDVSLDGLSMVSILGALGGGSPLSVPQEGIGRTQVVTSTYDVARGQFAGGQVSMSTARGTNRKTGSLRYTGRDPMLQSSATGSAFGNGHSQHQFSGGYGTPLVQNRLFLHGSFTLQRRSDHLFALTPTDPLALQRLGVHADSVQRFLSILETGYDFDLFEQTGDFRRQGTALSLMSRVDWNATDAHALMVSGGVNLYGQQNARVYPLELRQNGGEVGNSGYRGMVSLSSRLGMMWTNDLRVSMREGRSEQLPYDAMPEGQVRVASLNAEGQRVVSALTFGGDRSFPITSRERGFDVLNESSWLLGTKHRVKVGGLAAYSRFTMDRTTNRFGTFTFNSLADFEALQPSAYTRVLDSRETEGGGWNVALYAGDTWRPTTRLQITAGARLEGSESSVRPAYNAAVETAFGRRTDLVPTDVRLSPRVGFTYRLPGRSLRQLRGGIGEFRARPPFEVFASAQSQTGLGNGQIVLSCIGDATPIPDWEAYSLDPASIPTACRDGAPGRPLGTRRPSVTLFDDGFGAARSHRATLGYQMRLFGLMPINMEYGFTRGVGLPGVRDLNLDTERSFTLDAEGGRPFFGVPEAISTRTGAVSSLASRRDPQFAGVYDVHSGLRSEHQQLTFSFSGGLPPRILLSANYTLARTRDQGAGSILNPQSGFAAATTDGNPNERGWSVSSQDRRHTIMTTVAYPLRNWMDVAIIARFSSGSPFTPMVGGDINGDGVRNDRAFIFDPAATSDSAVANGMARMLAAAPDRVRGCVESQIGRIAARNSCRNGWTQTLEGRVTLRPQITYLGLDRRLSLSANTMNMLAGLDQLFHGRNDMRGWGQPTRADATLLYPRGFDPATQRFSYVVNEQFGQTRSGRFGFGMPFQLSVQAQLALGPQPQQFNVAAIANALGLTSFRALRSLNNPGQIVDRVFANPLVVVLELSDTLRLDDAQSGRIRAAADSLDARLQPLKAEMRGRVDVVPTQELPRVFQEMQPVIEAGREFIMLALGEVRAVLSVEQWLRLPTQVRAPFGDEPPATAPAPPMP
jgi:hypothetical protein